MGVSPRTVFAVQLVRGLTPSGSLSQITRIASF